MHLKTLLRERLFILGGVFSSLLLAGCAPMADALGGLGPVGDALRYASRPAARPDPTRMPVGFEYLQVQLDGRQALMVLGSRALVAGSPGQAEDEYWYSPQSELLHLRNGRVWRVLGMTTEWREQRSLVPGWAEVPTNGEPLRWQRQVDRMPGYRWAETEEVQTRRLMAPPAGEPARTWPQAQWFEDRVQARDAQGMRWEHAQRFALWQGRVVYSEQCIAPDLCVALSRLGH